jgi:hypothetical protein
VETTSSDFLNVPLVFDSDVRRAIRRLKSTKSVRPDDIPSFIIKGCSEIFVPVLKHLNVVYQMRVSPLSGKKQLSYLSSRKAAALL